MAYLKKEVAESVVNTLQNRYDVIAHEIRMNKYEIKKLALAQAILKRSKKEYIDLIWVVKNK